MNETPDSTQPTEPGPSAEPGPSEGYAAPDHASSPWPGAPHAQTPQHPVDPNAYPQYPVDPNAAAQYPGQAPQYPVDPNAYPQYPVDPNAAAQYPGQAPQYPVDPNATAAYPGQAPQHPGQVPTGAYAGAALPPKKGLSRGALIGIIAGAAAVVLIIAAAVIVPIVLRPAQASASDFVEGYLTALADGDAEKALTYVETSGEDALLTDDVLQASLELGAIDDITIGEKESDNEYGDAVVEASFTIGGEEVSRTFDVYSSSDGDDMYITDGLVSFSSPYGFEGLGLTVNGAEVPDHGYVFPGTYRFAVDLDAFAIDGESTFVLATDDDSEALYDVSAVLSEKGTTTFRDLVNASFAECLAMKSLNTPCGMDVTEMSQDGYTPVDGTVTRTIDAEAQTTLANLEPVVSERAVVSTYDYWSVDITLDASNGSETAAFEVLFGGQVLTPKVDFAAETPTVVWE